MSKQPHYENSLVCSCLLFLYMEAEIEIGDVYMFKKLFGQLQRIGKALMLPVAILPAAGILLAFGNAMHNEQLV
ncbi:PTS glucose transporter subunit IICBA, partial [Escherichia coli]|nr:PTS glucose transporter subunit IICBA [Escherichia coli]